MIPAKAITKIKQFLKSDKDAKGVLKFSTTLVIMSKFTACLPCACLPSSGLAASRTCLTEVLSIGDGTPAMSCAHLTPYSAASVGEDELQDWNLSMK